MKLQRKFKILGALVIMISLLSGVDALNAQKAPKKEKAAPKARDFTLNFKDVEIQEFLNMMSQLLGKNIITDDQVRGKITISSAKKVPISQAYDVMISILALKGFAVIETPNLLKVVPIRDAVKNSDAIIVDGKKLDLANDKGVVYILTLDKADVNEVTRVLTSLKSNTMIIVTYPLLNSIILSGNSLEVESLVKIAKSVDRDLPSEDGKTKKASPDSIIHVIRLQNAKAEDMAGILSKIPFSAATNQPNQPAMVRPSMAAGRTSGSAPQTGPVVPLSIIASKDTNSLIITCMPDEFTEIEKLVDQLDTVREQVLIEALIVEVNADSGWEFGINWQYGKARGANGTIIGSQNTANDPADVGNAFTGFQKSGILGLSGFSVGYVYNAAQLGFLLVNAAASDTNVNILSTPQIMTLDNQEAQINVGEEIPIASSRTDTTGGTTKSYDYKPVGLKLKVTPHITDGNKITLELYQEVNSIIGLDSPPKLGKRDITTRITIYDGKTIVVGGLITNQKNISETKVPVLGDIPLLGWLFKRKAVTYKKTNLLVFLTPKIVTLPEKADAVTKQKIEEQKMMRNDN